MAWLIVGAIGAVVFAAVAVMAVLAERRPDPAPERDIGAVELPGVRDELALRDVQLDRQRQREHQRTHLYRNDRGDTP